MTREQFAQAWRQQVHEDLTTDPLIRSDVSAIVARLNDAAAPRTALDDVVTQHPSRAQYDAYDAAALRHFGLMLNFGRYVIATIQLARPRQRQGDTVEVGTSLNQLPYPFVATHAATEGHRLRWTNPITISHAALPDRPLMIEFEPSDTAFAVGAIEPATALWHLRHSGGMARWPAGHNALTLILATDSDRLRGSTGEISAPAGADAIPPRPAGRSASVAP
jgi:hypothetical protein